MFTPLIEVYLKNKELLKLSIKILEKLKKI